MEQGILECVRSHIHGIGTGQQIVVSEEFIAGYSSMSCSLS